ARARHRSREWIPRDRNRGRDLVGTCSWDRLASQTRDARTPSLAPDRGRRVRGFGLGRPPRSRLRPQGAPPSRRALARPLRTPPRTADPDACHAARARARAAVLEPFGRRGSLLRAGDADRRIRLQARHKWIRRPLPAREAYRAGPAGDLGIRGADAPPRSRTCRTGRRLRTLAAAGNASSGSLRRWALPRRVAR